jgi:hypothetical protein
MNRFLIYFHTEEKYQEFIEGEKRIGITIQIRDSKNLATIVQYKEPEEKTIAAMTRVLEGFGSVLRCQ